MLTDHLQGMPLPVQWAQRVQIVEIVAERIPHLCHVVNCITLLGLACI